MRISDWSSDVCSSDLLARASRQVSRREDKGPVRRSPGGRRRMSTRTLPRAPKPPQAIEIGRASCRERVCPYVSISVVAVSFKKKHNNTTLCESRCARQDNTLVQNTYRQQRTNH